MTQRIKGNVPNAITSLNLLSGLVALFMAHHADVQYGPLDGLRWCYVFIAAAAVFDFCDGFAARLLHRYSPMGKELDSLCDLVSFGVAPATMMFNVMISGGTSIWAASACALIALCGALRLARFNVDTEQTDTFTGLPIPANALFWIGMSAWVTRYGYPGTAVMLVPVVLVSLWMVSGIRMFSLKFKNLSLRDNFRRYALIVAAIAFLIIYGLSGLIWTMLLYLLLSVVMRRKAEP